MKTKNKLIRISKALIGNKIGDIDYTYLKNSGLSKKQVYFIENYINNKAIEFMGKTPLTARNTDEIISAVFKSKY